MDHSPHELLLYFSKKDKPLQPSFSQHLMSSQKDKAHQFSLVPRKCDNGLM